jgi:hypothetical protein
MEKAAASIPEDVAQLHWVYDGPRVQENDATFYDYNCAPAFDGSDDDTDVDKEPANTFIPDSGPDKSVLELYEKLLLLRASPLDHDKFSQEE